MIVISRATGSQVRLGLSGELDLATAELFGEHVVRALAGGATALVLDLAGVTFCDSTGVDALIKARAEAERRGARLTAENARGVTRRSLEITGVLDLLSAARPV